MQCRDGPNLQRNKGSKADPQTPAGLFNHADTANTLISVALNNAYRKSREYIKLLPILVLLTKQRQTLR